MENTMTQPNQAAIAAARAAQIKWKIPASISLAQWALESGWGKHTSAPHNYFGMKALPGQPCQIVPTREVYKGHSVIIQAAFRSFTCDDDAFDAHGKLLATAGVYAHARVSLPDPIKFAHALTGTYATDPAYGALLESIIRGSNLTQYDA
jgi:flagellum-specific peptidoglycan hydrolase FlgJ